MTPARRSVAKLTERALRKCKKFSKDEVYVRCTPAEFLALCWHFEDKPWNMAYVEQEVNFGISRTRSHYIKVQAWDKFFHQIKYNTEESK